MSAPRPIEQRLLLPIEMEIEAVIGRLDGADRSTARLELLEGVSARVGGFSLSDYADLLGGERLLSLAEVELVAERLAEALRLLPIPAPLALSSLARPVLTVSEQRRTGAYYTDFRLAQLLADRIGTELTPARTVVDSAAGTGILLAAAALRACGADREALAAMVGGGLFASDLSREALRGTSLALASLTHDLFAIDSLQGHLREGDSLLAGTGLWEDLDGAFDVVVGNPPWEKLRLTRHEHLKSHGVGRNYGSDYANHPAEGMLKAARAEMANYRLALESRYSWQGTGESDLYKFFTELSFRLIGSQGTVGLLLPGGLLRSLGTRELREHLFAASKRLEISVLDNRANFFAIDTRVKFLAVVSRIDSVGESRNSPIDLRNTRMSDAGWRHQQVRIGRQTLRQIRPDLSVPEVASRHEWDIVRRAYTIGSRLDEEGQPWQLQISRELDMTNDRSRFVAPGSPDALPLLEGRHIQQFHLGAKRYCKGRGRSARWEVAPPGSRRLVTQFSYPKLSLSSALVERTAARRIGFCDVTGQTNERSMLAALVPAGVVCGNKVPTILLPECAGDEDAFHAAIAVFNSFTFDWLLRRVVTTSVNYFVLRGLPFPAMDPDSLPARRLASLARAADLSSPEADLWDIAQARAEIDARVAQAYGLDIHDLAAMLEDFPLLDRSQPSFPGEPRSTITRDYTLLIASDLLEKGRQGEFAGLRDRVEAARSAGAIPFIPSEAGPVFMPERREGVRRGSAS